jgi:hypothetical protein
LDLTFTRIAGGTMAISAAVEYSLQVRWSGMCTQGLPRSWCGARALTAAACAAPCAPIALQDAVSAGHLKSATYQRLMVAVVAKSSLYLTACLLVRVCCAACAVAVAAASAQQHCHSTTQPWPGRGPAARRRHLVCRPPPPRPHTHTHEHTRTLARPRGAPPTVP